MFASTHSFILARIDCLLADDSGFRSLFQLLLTGKSQVICDLVYTQQPGHVRKAAAVDPEETFALGVARLHTWMFM